MATADQNRSYAAAHFALELDGSDSVGLFRSIEGGGIRADVMTYQNGSNYDRWRQLGKPKFEDIKLQVGMAMSQPFYSWIAKFFGGVADRKTGSIVAADFYYKERARRDFTEAMIKELTFPKLDATDKNPAYMTVALAVEDIVFKKGSGAKLAPPAGFDRQKLWTAANFNFRLDGFDCCSRVAKVDTFTVKQNIIEHNVGGQRGVIKTPSPIDFPNITFYLPESDAQPLAEHAMKRITRGEVPGRLNGSLETYDHERRALATIEFMGCDIVSVTPDRSDSTSEEIKMVKVELYTESMKFTYNNVE
ncbi:MAG TPA: phage tail protein [Kofleriaceae bacterium]